jgi:molybdopterin-guanine dinucleotide biosynthesis protein A
MNSAEFLPDKRVLGVVLAGGASTRMGTDKALIDVAGRPMIDHVTSALGEVCTDLLIVGRRGTLNRIPCVPDDHPGRLGPAAGVATALRVADGQAVLVVAVDQPFLRTETLRRLVAEPLTTVPHDQVLQIACALYSADAFEPISDAIEKGLPLWKAIGDIARIVERVEWDSWGEDGRSWFSVDTPEKLDEGLQRFG